MNEKIPRVSVLMSVYSEPLEWIKQAIDSILNQTFSDFEFIIINDKPDRTELADFLELEARKDIRIKIHTNTVNLGLTKSLNVGLKLCKGKYIARMDADDISMPTRFAKQVAFMDTHPEVIVCGSRINIFGRRLRFSFNCFFENDIDIRGQMLHNSGIAHPSAIIRHDILRQHNITYDESFKSAQDYRLWEQLWDFGKFHNLQTPLIYYRISKHQITNAKRESQQVLRKIVKNAIKIKISDNLQTLSTEGSQIIQSYLYRAKVYDAPNISYLYVFLKNNHTKCSKKEILYISLRVFKKLFSSIL